MGISAAVDAGLTALGVGGTAAATDVGLSTLAGSGVLDAATAFGAGGGALATDAALAAGAGAGAGGLAAGADALGGVASAAGAASPVASGASTLGTVAGTVAPAAGAAASGGLSLGNLASLAGGAGQLLGGVSALNMASALKQTDPYAAYRPAAANQLQALLANPSSVTTTPGYQFNLAQGLDAMKAQQAAQGRLVSGGALTQAEQFGQNLASQSYQQQLNTLATLSGASSYSPTAATNALIGGAGATLGGYQAIAGGLGQVANPLATLYANYNGGNPTVQG